MADYTKRRRDAMRVPKSVAAASLAAALLLPIGCGSARRSEPLVGEKPLPNAEIALGQRVFDVSCSQCHPGGEGGLGPALNNKSLPAWLIRFQVRNGLGVMPSFSSQQISGAELDALTRYMVWLRRQDPRPDRNAG